MLQFPSGLLQKQALSGFSAGVPNTSEGGTNLEKYFFFQPLKTKQKKSLVLKVEIFLKDSLDFIS